MTLTLSQYKKQLTRPYVLIKLLAFLTILGFVPWGKLIMIEVKNHLADLLLNGLVGHITLLTLISLVTIALLNKNKWYSGLALLLFPIIIITGMLFTLVWTLTIPERHDLTVFKNGDKYLILEMEVGLFSHDESCRVVVSRSMNKNVRLLESIDYFNDFPFKLDSKILKYRDKTWEQVTVNDDQISRE